MFNEMLVIVLLIFCKSSLLGLYLPSPFLSLCYESLSFTVLLSGNDFEVDIFCYICSMKVELLKKEIERATGQRLKAAGDYEQLSVLVQKRTQRRLSPTTLKRLFGYLHNEEVTPRISTLDVLARFVGYDDYDAFCTGGNDGEAQSNIVPGERVSADELSVDSFLVLTWKPNRRCVVRYLGNARFLVVEALNTKLSVGDTFTCHLFICHEPLYIESLVHEGQKLGAYVAGKKDGVMVTRCSLEEL